MNARAFTAAGLVALSCCQLAACNEETAETVPDAPTFAEVNSTIFEPKCTFACHSGGEFAAGGLDLAVDPYHVLIDMPPTAVQCAGMPMNRIVPGAPEESLLFMKVMAKVNDEAAPCGDVMPPGANNPALTSDEVELLRAWIAAGAPSD